MRNDYYFLGFAFEDARLEDNKLVITKRRDVGRLLSEICKSYNCSKRTDFATTIEDRDIIKLFSEHGVFDKKRMLSIPEESVWSFIVGYFDAYGSFMPGGDNPKITIFSPRPEVIDFVSKHWKVRTHYVDKISAFGYKAIDICGRMYAASDYKNTHKYNLFWDSLNWQPRDDWHRKEVFRYMKLDPKAIPPCKERLTDSGYDIHAVELEKCYGNVYKADTKLAVKPSPGFYFDLVGRSSLPIKGWSFLQGVGVVDKSYQGNLMMHLMKLDDRPLPKLPFKCGQLIPRRIWHVEWESSNNLGETDRTSGFGSSDK